MGKVLKGLAGVLVVLLVLGWLAGDNTPPAATEQPTAPTPAATTPAPPPTPPPAPDLPPLELLSSSGSRSSDSYITVEGQVKNITDAPIQRLSVVVTILDKDDGFITADTGLVEYDPLLPGQTSPFKAIVRFNPAFAKYRIEFKRIGRGTTIDYKDSRK